MVHFYLMTHLWRQIFTLSSFLNLSSGRDHWFAIEMLSVKITISCSFTAVTSTTFCCVFVCFLLIPQQSSKKNCVQRLSPSAQGNISAFDVFSAQFFRNSIQHWWYNRILRALEESKPLPGLELARCSLYTESHPAGTQALGLECSSSCKFRRHCESSINRNKCNKCNNQNHCQKCDCTYCILDDGSCDVQ